MDITSVTNALTYLPSSDSVSQACPAPRPRRPVSLVFEEPMTNWGQTLFGSSGHPDTCGSSGSAEVQREHPRQETLGSSSSGQREGCVLPVGGPARAFVALTARKQFFLQLDYSLHPHSLNGQSFPLEAGLSPPLHLLIPWVFREQQGSQAGDLKTTQVPPPPEVTFQC